MGRSSSSTSSGGGGGGRYVAGSGSPDLPPGFRFHPTDEELVVHYLRNQALSRPCPVSIIPELNIYKFDPWELPARSDFGEGSEWYFFSPRDRKYPNGARPNRATASGYWKATGTDKAIYHDGRYVGVKKALVFYKGKPPRGAKSEWIMHEYRLGGAPGEMAAKMQQQPRKKGSMRLDDWVLCRIYQKKHQKRPEDELVPNYSSYDYLTPAAVPAVATPIAGEDSSCSYYLNAEASPPASVYDYEEPPPQQQRMPLFPTTPAIEHQQIQTQTQPQPQLQTQTLPLRFPRSCSLAHLLEAEYISMTQMMNDCGSADNFHAIASSLELEREADQFLHFDDDAAPALFQY